jgi:GWxTD domain-containing protein
MFRREFYAAVLLIVPLLVTGADAQLRSTDTDRQFSQFRVNRSLFFNYDVYRFPHSRDSVRVVVVISFVNDLVQFVKQSDSLYEASFELTFLAVDSAKNVYYDRTFRDTLKVTRFEDTNSRAAVHGYIHSFLLPAVDMKLRMEFVDLDTRQPLRRTASLKLRSFVARPIRVSDPVIFAEEKSPGGIPLQTFPERASDRIWPFGEGERYLSPFLVEDRRHFRLSGPVRIALEAQAAEGRDSLKWTSVLLDRDNRRVGLPRERQVPLASGTARIVELFEPDSILPGFYIYQILLEHGTNKRTVQVAFYLGQKPAPASADTTVAIDEFGALRYIVDSDLYETWTKLDSAGRDSVVRAFWVGKDPLPDTPLNELRQEFRRRVRFATLHFVSLVKGRPGWMTDQGRTYILYGPPAEVLHPGIEEGKYQHEVWIYQDPPMRFIFRFDPDSGEYILLASDR